MSLRPVPPHRFSSPILNAGWTVRGSIPPRGATIPVNSQLVRLLVMLRTPSKPWRVTEAVVGLRGHPPRS